MTLNFIVRNNLKPAMRKAVVSRKCGLYLFNDDGDLKLVIGNSTDIARFKSANAIPTASFNNHSVKAVASGLVDRHMDSVEKYGHIFQRISVRNKWSHGARVIGYSIHKVHGKYVAMRIIRRAVKG